MVWRVAVIGDLYGGVAVLVDTRAVSSVSSGQDLHAGGPGSIPGGGHFNVVICHEIFFLRQLTSYHCFK